jgi:hypothetical protein
MQLDGFEAPPPRIVHLLAHLTPREQGQALRRAFAAAVAAGRKRLERRDLPPEVLVDEADPSGNSSTNTPPDWLH